MDGEGEFLQKLPPKERKKRDRSARTNKVAVVPLVRILNRIGVQVPLEVVSVPVRVHRPKRMCIAPSMSPPLEYSRGCIVCGASKPTSAIHRFFFFF